MGCGYRHVGNSVDVNLGVITSINCGLFESRFFDKINAPVFKPSIMPQKKLASLTIDGEPEGDEYEVEDVIDFKFIRGQPKYLVKWKGFPSEDNTWEPEENMTNLPAFTNKMALMKEAYVSSKNSNTKKLKKMDSTTSQDNASTTDSVMPLEISIGSRKTKNTSDTTNVDYNNNGVKSEKEVTAEDKEGFTATFPEEAVEVEDLLDYKPRFKKDYFLVRWKGDWEDSWEPRKNLLIVGDLMSKMIDLKMSYLRIYGPSEMEDDIFVTVQSIRISGTATLSAVVVEVTRDTEKRTLLPLQEVRQRWPQQLLDFLLSRLRLRTSPDLSDGKQTTGTQIVPLR
ncbi:chromo domain containing protein [Theileria equi strain WA]|uniref:Chromo domain containing protein n=1 Tax=Theileria equi strain WA TaxID=1537102 RepID=L1LA05_THEEQ|nr:chromo domain containing protein [Theileria equi strain WA]EKX72045.1 chromo domain containing protein [Theileria equi strain WA]|eukprot:XP_004831497.1 chromo domain containing protein [Theileria equi strain WA]